ncbi:MAG TPA: class I SAM-dependent methyltransferase [Ilumatobacteraceae bacterium]|nr:class I SAM-dependent methyltransferase [Ilumatobacteraceae bacterium]
MGLYDTYVLPHLIELACGSGDIAKQRSKIVPQAHGRVLEVGMGPGLNLPFYDRSSVEFVWGLEPSKGMRRKAAAALEATDLEVRWLDLPSEEIPLDDHSVDTVVLTYTLCTIPDWERALGQMRRVLKPGGHLLFSEHGEAPDEAVRRWQHRIDPVWTRLAGGCHIIRPIPQLIESAGFEFVDVESAYLPGPKISSYHSWGMARPR